MPNYNGKTILFFDGVCGLCNNSVNFLMDLDSNKKILFSPLQGETAQQLLPNSYLQNLESLVVWKEGKTFQKTTAILITLREIGGIWSLFYIFIILPPFLRNIIYNLIAKYRYKWFGKLDACRMPTPEERKRFLP